MKNRNAMDYLRRVADEDPELTQALKKARMNARVAQIIYSMRTEAGLTQQQLAERIGTRQPVIARLEDADYGGHSLTMLQRIASALGYELNIDYKRQREEQPSAGARQKSARHRKPSS